MRLGDLDALKEDLKQYFSDGTLDSVSAKLAFNMILRKIDNAPTIEQKYYERIIAQINPVIEERPQGEWIIVKDEKWGDNVKCPFCGKELAGTDLNFCCKCGARLEGGEE